MTKLKGITLITRIGVCGGGKPTTDDELEFAWLCGAQVGQFLDVKVTYGACPGAPDEFVRGFLSAHRNNTARVSAISLWGDSRKHEGENFLKTPFPVHQEVATVFTGLGPGRNPQIIAASQIVIYLGGGLGTLDEMLLGTVYERHLFVAEGVLGGATSIIRKTLEAAIEAKMVKAEALKRLHPFTSPQNLCEQIVALVHSEELDRIPNLDW